MNARRPNHCWTLWVFAAALLLKAALPLLATASAQWQGKALAEVCTVYGVATVLLPGADAPPSPDHGAAHAGDHCALGAVVALALPVPVAPPDGALAATHATARSMPASSAIPRPDAGASWLAQRQHGPPSQT